jgi:uncharacterized membrane protein YsdA (DUF1294 family)/cold shock CspA family protein
MRHQGKITTWKDEQGFGFISPNGGGPQVFVHIKSFSNRTRRPNGSEIVTYEVSLNGNGQLRAENVAFSGERTQPKNVSRPGKTRLFVAVLFLVFVAAATFIGKLPVSVLGLYLGASAVAYIAYLLDKSAARTDQWRTKESTLHLFGLVGGWPGALLAQSILRHKSKKQSFQVVFWATVVLNCTALGWAFTPSGSKSLRMLLDAFSRMTT